MHAVIIAGGQGTRLRPLTDTRPKPLIPFMGEPFAVGLLRRLAGAGVASATFLVASDAAPWQLLLEAGPQVGIDVAIETEEMPLDTAGACRRLLPRLEVGGPVLVCNGDILTDLDYAGLVVRHRAAGATATLALTRVEDTSSFGVVVCDGGGRVERFVEKPPLGTLAADTVNAGTYVLQPDAFAQFPGEGPLSFERVVFPGLVEGGRYVLGVPSEAYWQDLGTPQRYLDGHCAVLEGRCGWPVAPGFHLDGNLVAVHGTARVAPSAGLGPMTVVGAGCLVAARAVVASSVLHDGVEVGEAAQITGTVLGPGSRVLEGARVTGAVVGDGAVVEPTHAQTIERPLDSRFWRASQ
ncbi:MAG: sugar phosphate nucleotidyltransferase [Egibacteraceae bacterium]